MDATDGEILDAMKSSEIRVRIREIISAIVREMASKSEAARATSSLDLVAAHYGIGRKLICGPDRHRLASEARAVVMWIERRRGLSWQEVAFSVNRQDHTSAMDAVRKVTKSHRLVAIASQLLDELKPMVSVHQGSPLRRGGGGLELRRKTSTV